MRYIILITAVTTVIAIATSIFKTKNNNIISSSHSTAAALVSNSIIDSSNDHNDDDDGDVVRQSDIFAEWFRRKDSPLVILNSNPGIVSVEELDDQRYQANISPLQFPGSF